MYRLSPLFRRWTAATFLVAFLGVFAGQCFCASSGVACTMSAAAPRACCKSGSSCHMKMPKQQGNARKAPLPDAGSNGCGTHVATFFASLGNPPAVAMAPAAPLWLSQPPVLDFSFARGEAWVHEQPVALVPPRHLKPKIPDVRVFIQSLTI